MTKDWCHMYSQVLLALLIATALSVSVTACSGGGDGTSDQDEPSAPKEEPQSVASEEAEAANIMLRNLEEGLAAGIVLTSPAFTDGEAIPGKHACYGQDVSPPLSWSGVPSDAKSVALVVFETDERGSGRQGGGAGFGVAGQVGEAEDDRFHWLLYDLPPDATELPETIRHNDAQRVGGTHGTNDFDRLGWGGPCPPFGPGSVHLYYFMIYALDRELALAEGATKLEVVEALEGHVLDYGQLTGTYQVKW